MPLWVGEVAHVLGLIPLIYLVWRVWWRSAKPDAEWWLVALAYTVSWVADTVAHGMNPLIPAHSYVMLQSGLIVGAVLPKEAALHVVGVFCVVALGAVVWLGPTGQIPLHTVTWLTVAGLAWRWRLAPDATRIVAALGMSFGIGWLAWMAMQWSPTFLTWGAYQGTRAMGTLLLCWAMARPFPVSRPCDSLTPSSSR